MRAAVLPRMLGCKPPYSYGLPSSFCRTVSCSPDHFLSQPPRELHPTLFYRSFISVVEPLGYLPSLYGDPDRQALAGMYALGSLLVTILIPLISCAHIARRDGTYLYLL